MSPFIFFLYDYVLHGDLSSLTLSWLQQTKPTFTDLANELTGRSTPIHPQLMTRKPREKIHETDEALSKRTAQLLKDADPKIVGEAIKTMVKIGAVSQQHQLIPLLKHPNWRVVCYALEAMGHFGSPEFRVPIEKLYWRHSDVDFKKVCLNALTEIRSPESIPFFQKVIRRKGPWSWMAESTLKDFMEWR